MHEGRRGRGLDDDVPIIGDYSDAQNERLRAESREPRSPSSRERRSAGPSIDAPPEPRAPSRAKDDLRPDPRDVRRYAANARRRQQIGPVRKALRFTPIVIAAAAAFLVYWNFETLRGVTVDFSALTSVFGRPEGGQGGRRVPLFGEPEPETVEDAGVVGAAAQTSLSSERDEEAAGAPEEPAEPAAPQPARAAETEAAAATPEPVAPAPEPVEAAPEPVVPAATPEPAIGDSALAAAAPEPGVPAPLAPPPEPAGAPPEPETLQFGLPIIEVSESEAGAAVIILRNGGTRGESTIVWWTRPGNATAGADYADLGTIVERFRAGEQNRTIHVPIVGDRAVEGPESFYVYVASKEGDEPEDQAEVVIKDDD